MRLQITYHFRVMIQQDFVATNRACRNLIRVYDQERKCDGKVLNSGLLQRSQQLTALSASSMRFILPLLFIAKMPFQQDFVSFPQITFGEFLF